jgi:hypothetical protein
MGSTHEKKNQRPKNLAARSLKATCRPGGVGGVPVDVGETALQPLHLLHLGLLGSLLSRGGNAYMKFAKCL